MGASLTQTGRGSHQLRADARREQQVRGAVSLVAPPLAHAQGAEGLRQAEIREYHHEAECPDPDDPTKESHAQRDGAARDGDDGEDDRPRSDGSGALRHR